MHTNQMQGFFELKYKTKRCVVSEQLKLKNQIARDCGRYDFIKDIMRLEKIVANSGTNCCGYALFLSNDQGYWEDMTVEDGRSPQDSDFRLSSGKYLNGELKWRGNPSDNTNKGRKSSLILNGNYQLSWEPYLRLDQDGGEFRFLIVQISTLQLAG